MHGTQRLAPRTRGSTITGRTAHTFAAETHSDARDGTDITMTHAAGFHRRI